MNKDIFCANCQETTSHQGVVDGNGEFVFSCLTPGCGRFIKFPSSVEKEEFEALLERHEEANVGQVNILQQEKKLAALLEEKTEEVSVETPNPEQPLP